MTSLLVPPAGLPSAAASPRTGGPRPRSVRIRGQRYPVLLPNVRDARLHVASVVMTIHLLGQTVLHFRVSAVQIAAAILTCFAIEVAVVFARTKQFVWPASAMLTGSGVGLIMRLPEMRSGTPWSTHGWWIYSVVAGLSLLTKYTLRRPGHGGGRHVFNPSNLGLVFVFVVLGSHVAEPLDFWWAPIDLWMAFAYALIIAGGTFVTHRVGLLPMAAAFWGTLAAGLAIVAATGHAIYSPWALHPVRGWHFWWVVLLSPETLIFVYFMLSDPKTVPRTRRAGVAFGVTVALLATLLIAPQHTEFATKVALLGALTIGSALRFAARPVWDACAAACTPRRLAGACTAAIVGAGAIVALAPTSALPDTVTAALPALVPPVAPRTGVPQVGVTPLAARFDAAAAARPDDVAAALVQSLDAQRDALRGGSAAPLAATAYGHLLDELRARVAREHGQDVRTAPRYTFTSLRLVVVPSRSEGANRLALDATGTVAEVEYHRDGSEHEVNPHPLRALFVLRRAKDRWLLVDVISPQRPRRASLQ